MSERAVPPRPLAGKVARALRVGAAVLAGHGLLLWLADALHDRLPAPPETISAALFWVLAVPALVLTRPFTPLFWKLGLMNAPGWFAWPKALGVALAYGSWIAALLAVAWLVRLAGRRPGAAR
ncbi:MAG TPA: hypothetical protein VGE20_02460 [Ramlibacter sp.]